MGITPQFADLNGDGHEDMISGCFEGTIYVSWGNSNGLDKPVHLKDRDGNLVHTGKYFHLKKEKHVTFGDIGERTYSAFPFDWDHDGDLDLITGTGQGGLYVRFNEGSVTKPEFASQVKPLVMEGSDEGARVDDYAMPVVADWNGDGLPDIVTGSKSGAFWFQNVGTIENPVLSEPKQLICGLYCGDDYPGRRLQVWATDFDGDGDVDLLVGDKRAGKEKAGFIWLYRRIKNSGPEIGAKTSNPPEVAAASQQDPTSEAELISEIDLDELPGQVKDGVTRLFPEVILTRASQELRAEGKVYVVLGRKDAEHFRFHVNDEGQAFQLEMGSDAFELELPQDQDDSLDNDIPKQEVPLTNSPSQKSSRRAAIPAPSIELPEGAISTQIDLKLIRIEPQNFWMGSPEDEEGRDTDETYREVQISHVYWLGETEVTHKQWTELMGTEPWKDQVHVSEGDNIPATHVSWQDAMQFCSKLNELESEAGNLPAGYQYTLPTEAQWELACRAGSRTRWSFGNSEEDMSRYAVYDNENHETHVRDVKSCKPNEWGFHDMHGNIAEWCADAVEFDGGVRNDADETTVDPIGMTGKQRACRGGCFRNSALGCRSALRDFDHFSQPSPGFIYGFRVALVAVASRAQVRTPQEPRSHQATSFEVQGASPAAPYETSASLEDQALVVNIRLEDGWHAYSKNGSKGEAIRISSESGDVLGELRFPETPDGILSGDFKLVQHLNSTRTSAPLELILHLCVCNEDGCLPPKQIRLVGQYK